MKRNLCRTNKVCLLVLGFLLAFMVFSSVALADTCADCHTSLDKLKKLASAHPEPPKKLSEGEG